MQADVVCGTNSVAQGFQVCHCEAPKGPWAIRSTWPDNKMAPAKTQLPARDSHVASLLGMTNLVALRHGINTSNICNCPWRSVSAMQADVVCGTNSVAQGFQVCHCEAPKGPWQSRSTRPDNKMAPAKTQLPARDSHVASLLGMTNLVALRHGINTSISATAHGAQ